MTAERPAIARSRGRRGRRRESNEVRVVSIGLRSGSYLAPGSVDKSAGEELSDPLGNITDAVVKRINETVVTKCVVWRFLNVDTAWNGHNLSERTPNDRI